MIKKEMLDVLLTEDEIREKVKEIAAQINKDYNGKDLTVVGILKGAVLFYSDLVRNLDMNISFDFMTISSYGSGTDSTGEVKIKKDLDISITGKNVLIVEDIVDTGLTLNSLKKILSTRTPASLKICTLLDKPSRRRVEIVPDYCCFSIPDKFVIGYGLDYDQYGRQYKNIYSLKPEYIDKI